MKTSFVLFISFAVQLGLAGLCWAAPAPPVMTHSTNGLNVTVNWSQVADATGYTLYYAPYPYTGADSIGSLDVGTDTSFSIDLWEGAAYYIAVTARNSSGESAYSNIDQFMIVLANSADIDDDNDGFTENQGDQNDSYALSYPNAPEACDGQDNNYNGQVDETCNSGTPLSGGDTVYSPPAEFETITEPTGQTAQVAKDELLVTVVRDLDSSQIQELITFLETNGVEIIGHSSRTRLIQIRIDSNANEAALIETISDHPYVLSVDYNRLIDIEVSSTDVDSIISNNIPVQNDWWIDQINAREAWALASGEKPGDPGVKIGIVDSILNDDVLAAGRVTEMDSYGNLFNSTDTSNGRTHGDMVSALAAGDGMGTPFTLGIAWESDVLFADTSTSMTYGNLVIALETLVDEGADILSMSIGPKLRNYDCTGADRDYCINRQTVFKEFLTNTFEYARDQNDALVVISAGNDSLDMDQLLPTGSGQSESVWNSNVLVVGATAISSPYTNPDDLSTCRRTGYSNYGDVVNISAPGAYDYGAYMSVGNPWIGTRIRGTSAATPIVAGAAALIAAENPLLSGSQIRQILLTSAAQDGLPIEVGQDMGGLLDIEAAVLMAQQTIEQCTDNDSDGFSPEGGECGAIDCDDSDASIHPEAEEICGDGIDQDCDGVADENCMANDLGGKWYLNLQETNWGQWSSELPEYSGSYLEINGNNWHVRLYRNGSIDEDIYATFTRNGNSVYVVRDGQPFQASILIESDNTKLIVSWSDGDVEVWEKN